MSASAEYVENLIKDPREGLPVEVKNWIDPATGKGKEKIVKACLALRNYGGGFLIIGFNSQTYQPEHAPSYDPRAAFDTDDINTLVNRYASESFEVVVHFPTRDGREFPVLEAEQGVVTPVATRRPLTATDADGNNTTLVKADTVYVRSMNSNGTPSTTEAGHQDWRTLVERCFDNREADIGRFLRRHLGERGGAEVERIFSAEGSGRANPALAMLDSGRERFRSLLKQRGNDLPDTGTWEVAACLAPPLPYEQPTQAFLNRLDTANPRYTGWPMWVNSIRFHDERSRPYVLDDGWETSLKADQEFWRIEPQGNFYAFRPLRDDTADFSQLPGAPAPGTTLELVLMVRDLAHALGVLLAFCRHLGAADEAVLDIGFRWCGLHGRQLSAWYHPDRSSSDDSTATAVQNELTSTIRMPVDTPEAALPDYVNTVASRLFAVFGGQSVPERVVEEMSGELLSRR